MKKVGFTTSIPVEVLFAAGITPVDLNNIFITNPDPSFFIDAAENAGFPRSTCAWIKGIYSAILASKEIDTIIGVVEGDCSNTRALTEVLELKGIKSIPFSYPNSGSYAQLKNEIEKLCDYFGVTLENCKYIKEKLDAVRRKLRYLDELTWLHDKATGFENHLWQVSASDFNGDYEQFDRDLTAITLDIEGRTPSKAGLRLGYIGVPPVSADIYDFIETNNAKVVFNEVQRQFTMADGIGNNDLVEVYRQFTYPYTLKKRLDDIKQQLAKRRIDGIIHYTQAFCFRGIEDIVIRKDLDIPILTLEGDRPGGLDARTKLRIEAFMDMLQ